MGAEIDCAIMLASAIGKIKEGESDGIERRPLGYCNSCDDVCDYRIINKSPDNALIREIMYRITHN